VAAVVEGFSETGSDGDVSESCQILLQAESRVINSQVGEDVLGVVKHNVVEMSESIPNNLGTNGELLVNSDGDNRGDPILLESAGAEGAERLLETGVVGSQSDQLVSNEKVGSLEGCYEVAVPVLNDLFQLGPAQLVDGADPVLVDEEGYDVDKEGVSDTYVLRTKDGDVPLCGPPIAGPSYFAALGVTEDEVESKDEVESIENSTIQHVVGGGVVRK
jgi:hypothetical protein